jgi:hypothetical protein
MVMFFYVPYGTDAKVPFLPCPSIHIGENRTFMAWKMGDMTCYKDGVA